MDIQEKVAGLISYDCSTCGKDGTDACKLIENKPCAKDLETANAIHAFYLQEGYVKLTVEELNLWIDLITQLLNFMSAENREKYVPMLAKLKAVGEGK